MQIKGMVTMYAGMSPMLAMSQATAFSQNEMTTDDESKSKTAILKKDIYEDGSAHSNPQKAHLRGWKRPPHSILLRTRQRRREHHIPLDNQITLLLRTLLPDRHSLPAHRRLLPRFDYSDG